MDDIEITNGKILKEKYKVISEKTIDFDFGEEIFIYRVAKINSEEKYRLVVSKSEDYYSKVENSCFKQSIEELNKITQSYFIQIVDHFEVEIEENEKKVTLFCIIYDIPSNLVSLKEYLIKAQNELQKQDDFREGKVATFGESDVRFIIKKLYQILAKINLFSGNSLLKISWVSVIRTETIFIKLSENGLFDRNDSLVKVNLFCLHPTPQETSSGTVTYKSPLKENYHTLNEHYSKMHKEAQCVWILGNLAFNLATGKKIALLTGKITIKTSFKDGLSMGFAKFLKCCLKFNDYEREIFENIEKLEFLNEESKENISSIIGNNRSTTYDLGSITLIDVLNNDSDSSDDYLNNDIERNYQRYQLKEVEFYDSAFEPIHLCSFCLLKEDFSGELSEEEVDKYIDKYFKKIEIEKDEFMDQELDIIPVPPILPLK